MAKTNEAVKALVAQLAAQVVEALESGATWTKGWVSFGGHRKLSDSKLAPYQGVNQFFLTLLAMIHDLPTVTDDETVVGNVWGGGKTWTQLGFMMKKGTKSLYRPILAFRVSFCEEHESKCESDCAKRISFMRTKTLAPIFHVSQVFKLDEAAVWPVVGKLPNVDITPPRILDNWKVAGMSFREVSADRAFFSPAEDYINLPPVAAFKSEGAYQNTLNHEAVHWSGHESRLSRKVANVFGTPDYAREELVAEIGAAMLAVQMDLAPEPHPEHATYLASWIKALKEDPQVLYTAAIQAERATDYLIALGQVGEMAA